MAKKIKVFVIVTQSVDDRAGEAIGLSLFRSRKAAEQSVIEDAQDSWDNLTDDEREAAGMRPRTFKQACELEGYGDDNWLEIRELEV